MNPEIKSSLVFRDYIVKKVLFEYHTECTNEEAIDIDLDMKVKFDIDDEAENMWVMLEAELFKHTDKTKCPFSMEIEVAGLFSMAGNTEDLGRYKSNAVAILFPYVRALISSYTANANVTPLVLPPINVNKLLENNK